VSCPGHSANCLIDVSSLRSMLRLGLVSRFSIADSPPRQSSRSTMLVSSEPSLILSEVLGEENPPLLSGSRCVRRVARAG
jgi:hypothetical protein